MVSMFAPVRLESAPMVSRRCVIMIGLQPANCAARSPGAFVSVPPANCTTKVYFVHTGRLQWLTKRCATQAHEEKMGASPVGGHPNSAPVGVGSVVADHPYNVCQQALFLVRLRGSRKRKRSHPTSWRCWKSGRA